MQAENMEESLEKYDHIDLLHPSKYLKCADLRGKSFTLTITGLSPRSKLKMRGGAEEKKPVLYFKEAEKALVLNVTNKLAIAEVHGPKPSVWIGKKVTIKPAKDRFGGKLVDCIRVDVAATKKALTNGQAKINGAAAAKGAATQRPKPPPTPPPEETPDEPSDSDDSIDGPLFGAVDDADRDEAPGSADETPSDDADAGTDDVEI